LNVGQLLLAARFIGFLLVRTLCSALRGRRLVIILCRRCLTIHFVAATIRFRSHVGRRLLFFGMLGLTTGRARSKVDFLVGLGAFEVKALLEKGFFGRFFR
jgi:hypothetical protein